MIRLAAPAAAALLAFGPLASAADPTPPAAPAPAATPANAPRAPAAKQITLDYKGTLHDGLKKIASQGGLNLVITGELNEPSEIILNGASPEEALATVAHAHNLKITHQGSIWTLRPLNAAEKAAADKAAREDGDSSDRESDEDDAATAQEAADAAREQAQEAADAAREAAQESADQAREQAEEQAQQAREQAQEQAEQAREQGRLLEEMMRRGAGRNSLSGTGPQTVAEGQTVDKVVSFGGSVRVLGHVTEDAVAFGGPVYLGPHAVVDGNVVTFGGKVERAPGAQVHGEIRTLGSMGSHSRDDDSSASSEHSRHESGLPWFLVKFALLFGVGFIASMFFPDRMKVLEGELRRDPLRCGVMGVVGTIGLLPATLALVVTCIGIVFIPVLYLVAIVATMVGFAALAKEVGARIPVMSVRKTQAMVLALGALLVLTVGLIPIVGPITQILVGFISFGVVLRTRFGTRRLGFPEPV